MNNTTKTEKTLRQKEQDTNSLNIKYIFRDYEKEKQAYQKLEAAYTQEKQ
jgi:hypothetical protein